MKRRELLLAVVPAGMLAAGKKQEAVREYAREFEGAVETVDVETISGDVSVRVGYGKGVRVKARIRYSAEMAEDLALAEREVKFEPRVEGKVLRVWVEAGENRRWGRYQFLHDVEVEAPAGVNVAVRHVNGAVEIRDRSERGGRVYVKQVNGRVNVLLPERVAADVEYSSTNGSLYSDYDVVPGVKEETTVTEKGMKRIVSRTRSSTNRIGAGGREVRVTVVNGDLQLRKLKAGE